MSESVIGRTRLLSSCAFVLSLGLSLFGCSGDDSDQAERSGAGQNFCAEGWDSCNGSCVVLATDGANCGSCGAACDAGQICVDGACAPDAQIGTGGSGSGGTSATGGGTST
ncbi:MAG: hypothetical protein JW940_05415 [Polyangiaceae bacterium]|nr:hypothetical protein [Polyangiaceae bacterium]